MEKKDETEVSKISFRGIKACRQFVTWDKIRASRPSGAAGARPEEQMVGEVLRGWNVMLTTLAKLCTLGYHVFLAGPSEDSGFASAQRGGQTLQTQSETSTLRRGQRLCRKYCFCLERSTPFREEVLQRIFIDGIISIVRNYKIKKKFPQD